MELKKHERTLLQVVDLSKGEWDTRNLDFAYYSRSPILLEPNILSVLRDLETRGLVESVSIEGSTGPGWRLTDEGRRVLRANGHDC